MGACSQLHADARRPAPSAWLFSFSNKEKLKLRHLTCQRIPTPSRKCSKPGPQSQGLENEKMAMDEDVATAHSLQPLLEQEALLEYVHTPFERTIE